MLTEEYRNSPAPRTSTAGSQRNLLRVLLERAFGWRALSSVYESSPCMWLSRVPSGLGIARKRERSALWRFINRGDSSMRTECRCQMSATYKFADADAGRRAIGCRLHRLEPNYRSVGGCGDGELLYIQPMFIPDFFTTGTCAHPNGPMRWSLKDQSTEHSQNFTSRQLHLVRLSCFAAVMMDSRDFEGRSGIFHPCNLRWPRQSTTNLTTALRRGTHRLPPHTCQANHGHPSQHFGGAVEKEGSP